MTRRFPLLLAAAFLAAGPAQAYEETPAPEGRLVEPVPDRGAALRGDPAAQYRVGAYFLERHVETPQEAYRREAFKWLFASARQDHEPAQYLLGHILPPESPVYDADALLRASARSAKGPPEPAVHRLIGRYLLTGQRRSRRDGLEAVVQLEIATVRGDRESALLLARLYARIDLDWGTQEVLDRASVPYNLRSAGEWALRAAQKDDELGRRAGELRERIEELVREQDYD